jgi:uncharacterized Ntn-hydrolase superfamily protein
MVSRVRIKTLPHNLYSTYSIVARDPETGQLGVAVQTHQMCVGSRVPWLEPGVGALATQSLANFSFGPIGMALLKERIPAPQVIAALVASDAEAHRRQIGVVDAEGRAAAWTGDGCIAEAGHHIGDGYSVQANMMTRPTVIAAMRDAYEGASGDLAQRMMAALQAAQSEDGDIRGMQSAALKVVTGKIGVKEGERFLYDLRVDEHADPVSELARLVTLNHARRIDDLGYEAFENGEREQALGLWAQAREEAPELEELAFWQAMTLADKPADVEMAAAILRPVLEQHERREHWLDLIHRLSACGLIEREGAGEQLIAALYREDD